MAGSVLSRLTIKCFAGDTPVHVPAATGQSRTVPIERLKVGDRVIGQNPLIDRDDPALIEPDWTDYVAVTATVGISDYAPDALKAGGRLKVTMLRERSWLSDNDITEGTHAYLDIPVADSLGEALVLSIDAVDIRPGPGRVVMSTFEHQSGNLLKATAAGETIRTTPDHPWWDQDAGHFHRIDRFEVGTTLCGLSGPAPLQSLREIGGPHRVHNVTVHGENVYRVGEAGLLVHNANSYGDAPKGRFPEADFAVQRNPGGDLLGIDVNFNGATNSGFVQTTLTRSTRDLYIDTTRSAVHRQGLGEAMFRRALAEAEEAGTTVTTMSGHLLHLNRKRLLSNGLEATPAYKLRVKLGFSKVIQRPTAENGFHLIMGR